MELFSWDYHHFPKGLLFRELFDTSCTLSVNFRSFALFLMKGHCIFKQSDLETCREELEFTNHKNRELEKIISVEREKVKDLDGKLKVQFFLFFLS